MSLPAGKVDPLSATRMQCFYSTSQGDAMFQVHTLALLLGATAVSAPLTALAQPSDPREAQGNKEADVDQNHSAATQNTRRWTEYGAGGGVSRITGFDNGPAFNFSVGGVSERETWSMAFLVDNIVSNNEAPGIAEAATFNVTALVEPRLKLGDSGIQIYPRAGLRFTHITSETTVGEVTDSELGGAFGAGIGYFGDSVAVGVNWMDLADEQSAYYLFIRFRALADEAS